MPTAAVPDLKYWLGFNQVKGIGPAKLRALLDHFGDLAADWQANACQLERIGIDRLAIRNLIEGRAKIDLDVELARITKLGIKILVWTSPDYPRYLLEIPNPPPLLFVSGDLIERDCWSVGVVGTRRLTTYGRLITKELVTGLVSHGVTIVSGLARGIDGVAHKAAIEAGGRTIAVLGSGLDRVYPSEHRNLARQIVDGNGAVITEHTLGVPPDAKNFPPRNRVVSGLSLGVIVVEAGQKSGALITAGFALEQNREVFAVPGNINSPASEGTNRLIQQGAKLVSGIEDVLEELNLKSVSEQVAVQMALPESVEEAAMLSLLTHQPTHIDELIRGASMTSSEVSSTLSLMELKGMVHQVGGMNYVLAREPDPLYEVDDNKE